MTVSVLVEPDFHTAPEWSRTLGDEVADLGRLVGFEPYPEQRLILDDVFALDPRDLNRSAAFEVAAIACRQQLKTGVLKLCALGWLFITDQQLVVWSAHEFGTSREAFRDLTALIDGCDYLSRRVLSVTTSAGNEAIELRSGARLKFKARTSGGGRGLTGNKVILDEAFALMPEHMGALLPTLIQVPDPQVLYGSSAGLARSAILRALRDRGRVGGGRLAYAEWLSERRDCAVPMCLHHPGTEGCVLDDVDQWRQACIVTARQDPTMEVIRSLRDAMPPEEFMRECLGWWDDPTGTDAAFGEGNWRGCAVPGRPAAARVGALAVATSFDQGFACISAGARHEGVVHVKPLEYHPGTSWVVSKSAELQRVLGVEVAVDGRGPAASLIEDLEAAGVRLRVLETEDVLDACAWVYTAVTETRGLAHGEYPELDRSVAGAVKRPVGDRWAWGRKTSTADLAPLESVTFAGWLASQRPDRKPPTELPVISEGASSDPFDSPNLATVGF